MWSLDDCGYSSVQYTYDEIGNPLSDGEWTYTWQHGRQLASMTDGETTWDYTYGQNGLRTNRTDGTTNYQYVYEGDQLVFMARNGLYLRFAYTPKGTPVSVTYKNVTYYYVTNIQGDVIAILSQNGYVMAEYTYDAWGNVLSVTGSLANTLGKYNPLRYRGYVYDVETGLYYLQSRYYNPKTGRFISADNIDLLGANGDFASLNLFAYCGNNPITREDSNGRFWLVSIGVGLASQYIGDVVKNLLDGKTGVDIFTPTSSAGEYIAAGVTALIPGSGLGGALIRNVVAEGITVVEDIILGNEVSVVDSVVNIGVGSLIDVGFEMVSDTVTDFIASKEPKNYSSYANEVRRKSPDMGRVEVYNQMQRAIRYNRATAKAVAATFDIIRAVLPY